MSGLLKACISLLLTGCATAPAQVCPANTATLDLENSTTIYRIPCLTWDEAVHLVIGAKFDGKRLIDWQLVEGRP